MNTLLEAKKRDNFQKSGLTQLRGEGSFPAIVYGKDVNSESVYVSEGEFYKIIKEVGRNGVIPLKMDGKTYNVVLQDYQQDPIKNHIIHADFLAVDLSSEMTAEVRVDPVGEAIGTKEGGTLQQPLFELTVTAKVSEFPENIAIDVSDLKIGDTIGVGDIRDKYDFDIAQEDEETIFSVLAPRVEEEVDEEENVAGSAEEA